MKHLIFILSLTMAACGHPPATTVDDKLSLIDMNGFDKMEIITVSGHKAFIRHPEVPSATLKWVWYAPSFLNGGMGPTPMPQQMGWYFDKLSKAGITVVGMDIGESFGSPEGRDRYQDFYDVLQSRGFEPEGCMIVQSRGGLMGYNWLMDHPNQVKCVAGIYPLVTVTGYVGIAGMAPAWGVTEQWLKDNIATQSPLERKDPLPNVNVFHLHGDADNVVHMADDQAFIGQIDHGALTIVPGKGHEFDDPGFFQSTDLLNFLLQNL